MGTLRELKKKPECFGEQIQGRRPEKCSYCVDMKECAMEGFLAWQKSKDYTEWNERRKKRWGF
jgi:hypothetical protein